MPKKTDRKTPVPRVEDWGWVMEHQNGTERRYSKVEESEGDRLMLCYCVMPPRGYAFLRVNSRETMIGEAIWDLSFRCLKSWAGRPIPTPYLNNVLKYKDSFLVIGESFPEERLTMQDIISALESVQKARSDKRR
jgi:hypothetical protein